MERKEIDILVGTQIIAKGHHFPNLTLIGIIDADLGLMGSDLRASEQTYQLLSQVAGRAGLGEKSGTVFLQTVYPSPGFSIRSGPPFSLRISAVISPFSSVARTTKAP